jgi:hypothetical protein
MFICELSIVAVTLKRRKGCAILTREKGLVTRRFGFYDGLPFPMLKRRPFNPTITIFKQESTT